MKQGSIMNFIKGKTSTKKKEAEKDDKEEVAVLSEMVEKNGINGKSEEVKIKSKGNSNSKEKSKASIKSAEESENQTSNRKRRHIVDDDEEIIDKENELAEDLLIPSKSAKKEASNSNNIITSTDEQIEVNAKTTISIKKNSNQLCSINFDILVKALAQIETTKGEGSKDIMKEVLAELFKNIIVNSPDDLSRAYYFLLSKIGPEYKSEEFGIGDGILEKVVAKAIGKSDKHIKERMVELGDLALVAMEGKRTLGTMEKFTGFVTNTVKKELTIKQVMDIFRDLANIKGKSSYAEKEKLLVKLLFTANKEEIKYIVRSLKKGLKIGASFKTIVSALARAVCKIYNQSAFGESKGKSSNTSLEEKEVEKTVLIAINQLSDEDVVFQHMIEVINNRQKFNNLINLCSITPGIPVKPQLARPTTGVKLIFQRFEEIPFSCEYKYDGFRGQVHHYSDKDGKSKTEIFSRNLENMTVSYPDIIEYVDSIHSDKVNSFILDCEIVPIDPKTNKILPFQSLTTRARKNVSAKEISTQVCMFLFDILYLNGESVCEKTLEERRKILKDNFEETEKIQFAKYVNSDKVDEIEGFMNEAIAAGCEGLIVKALQKNSMYQPGQRNFNWLKLKKDYLETSIGDSLDLVPIGAEYGKGRRKGFYGSYLLACWDDENDRFQTVTMTGAGLTDENLENLYKELSQHIIKEPKKDYEVGNIAVDVWFDPIMVWEIKTADLSLSPIYTAGNFLTNGNRGISLRFPRFIRVRPDKKPEECTSAADIYKMYQEQEKLTKKINFAEEEFYD